MSTTSPHPVDARVATVEANLISVCRAYGTGPLMATDGHPDVETFWSEIPHPMLNVITGARFATYELVERTRSVLAPFLDRGNPFLWWASGWTPELDSLLRQAGLEPEQCRGMHLSLAQPHLGNNRVSDVAVDLEVVTEPGAGSAAALQLMQETFELPDEVADVLESTTDPLLPSQLLHVLASVDGEPAGCGSVFLDGRIAGLYNIATPEPFRGRGIGTAVTEALLDVARERGCAEAVLHASELGHPVYARLGFDEVCQVPQYVWLPAGQA